MLEIWPSKSNLTVQLESVVVPVFLMVTSPLNPEPQSVVILNCSVAVVDGAGAGTGVGVGVGVGVGDGVGVGVGVTVFAAARTPPM